MGLYKAIDINVTVVIDEKDCGVYISQMNFEDWTIIKSKDPNFVIKVFVKHWISQFDSLKNIFSDNGG